MVGWTRTAGTGGGKPARMRVGSEWHSSYTTRETDLRRDAAAELNGSDDSDADNKIIILVTIMMIIARIKFIVVVIIIVITNKKQQ